MAAMLRLTRIIQSMAAPRRGAFLRSRPVIARDMQYGGAFAFSGTLKENGVPVQGRVVALDARSGLLVRESWSNPVTGAYSIPMIRRLPDGYDVILYAPTQVTRAKVFRNINPD